MHLLVINTSGKNGSVALASDGQAPDPESVKTIHEVPLSGGTFSAQLVPQIMALLKEQGLSKTDIGAFVVVSGPGSFTGLRVGLAAVKALSEILHKPIVPVSLLEVMALAAKTAGGVLAALDAGRGEVYVGGYQVVSATTNAQWEQLVSKEEFVSIAKDRLVCTPDASLAELARHAGLSVCPMERVTAAMIARLGTNKLEAGDTVSPEQLDANYIRRSDAEIFSRSK
jgi:tRNA threonylcarbamoyladenosine biosynthesis protein TsaB